MGRDFQHGLTLCLDTMMECCVLQHNIGKNTTHKHHNNVTSDGETDVIPKVTRGAYILIHIPLFYYITSYRITSEDLTLSP